jgi:hypothetical protein
MALNFDLASSQYGVAFTGAYFRIATAAVGRQRDPERKFLVMIDIVGYATQTPDNETREVDFRRYHAPLDEVEAQLGTAFLAKCYSWVANQPDMAGSTPV